ncbi:unknown protein [Desulfotalea psychrophila LSv54]|uniref:Uncharacterized protein n=1 Tax=Desulfotalea psychrophila (strain LSv54 / DSM 12343) TaxID=177439 RepID=Q6AP85_DESPS|nr:unknown protein [Desulfotalea psychrophila LSv54]
MWGMNPTKGAIFIKLKLIRSLLLVLCGGVITTLTGTTSQGYYISHLIFPIKNLPYLTLKSNRATKTY